MKRIGLLLSLVLMLLLAACGAGGGAELPASGGAEAVVEPATESENGENESETAVDDVGAEIADADPALIRDRDWTKGASDPLVTVIEYGDFQ